MINTGNTFYGSKIVTGTFLAFSAFSITWITLYTINPNVVQVTGENEIYPTEHAPPDPVKCWMYSILISVTLLTLLWGLTRTNSSSEEFPEIDCRLAAPAPSRKTNSARPALSLLGPKPTTTTSLNISLPLPDMSF